MAASAAWVRRKELEYCAEHPVYFAETYGHIEDKSAAELIQPFRLWPAQKQALKELATHRMNVILKARQLGITWLALTEAVRLLLCQSGRTVVAISRAEDEAKELVRRAAVILRSMPELVREERAAPPGWAGPVFRAASLELTLRFPWGPDSVFKALLSSPGAARGFTADLVILDEWAFQQFAEEIWASIFPVMNRPGSGRVIGLSTIKRGTLFEEIFTDPHNGFHKIFLPWQADPARDEAWYEATRKALGPDKTLQEYPASVEQALRVPGGQFFPEVTEATHLRGPDNFFAGPVRRFLAIDYGLDMFSAHWIGVDAFGRARVYREYDAPDQKIGEAAETARALSGGEEIEAVLAPPDLWSRSQESGRSRAAIFEEHGLPLTRTSNDFEAGCAGMKEWLRPGPGGEPLLTIGRGQAPNLFRCLQKILKDPLRPDVYAKEPHALTHDCDSLRAFCVWWAGPAAPAAPRRRAVWEADQYEDYEHASPAQRQMLIERWGDPF